MDAPVRSVRWEESSSTRNWMSQTQKITIMMLPRRTAHPCPPKDPSLSKELHRRKSAGFSHVLKRAGNSEPQFSPLPGKGAFGPPRTTSAFKNAPERSLPFSSGLPNLFPMGFPNYQQYRRDEPRKMSLLTADPSCVRRAGSEASRSFSMSCAAGQSPKRKLKLLTWLGFVVPMGSTSAKQIGFPWPAQRSWGAEGICKCLLTQPKNPSHRQHRQSPLWSPTRRTRAVDFFTSASSLQKGPGLGCNERLGSVPLSTAICPPKSTGGRAGAPRAVGWVHGTGWWKEHSCLFFRGTP